MAGDPSKLLIELFKEDPQFLILLSLSFHLKFQLRDLSINLLKNNYSESYLN